MRENDQQHTKATVSNNADNVSSEGVSLSPPALDFMNNVAPIQRSVDPGIDSAEADKKPEGDIKAKEDMPKGAEIYSGPVKTRVATSEGALSSNKPEELGSLKSV